MKALKWLVAKIVCFWDGHIPIKGYWDGDDVATSENYRGVFCSRCHKYWGPREPKNSDEHRY